MKSCTCCQDKSLKSYTYFTNSNNYLPTLLPTISLKIMLTLLLKFCLWYFILSHYAYKIHEGGRR